jgi:hypothetical protein
LLTGPSIALLESLAKLARPSEIGDLGDRRQCQKLRPTRSAKILEKVEFIRIKGRVNLILGSGSALGVSPDGAIIVGSTAPNKGISTHIETLGASVTAIVTSALGADRWIDRDDT